MKPMSTTTQMQTKKDAFQRFFHKNFRLVLVLLCKLAPISFHNITSIISYFLKSELITITHNTFIQLTEQSKVLLYSPDRPLYMINPKWRRFVGFVHLKLVALWHVVDVTRDNIKLSDRSQILIVLGAVLLLFTFYLLQVRLWRIRCSWYISSTQVRQNFQTKTRQRI
jgi:hypothetical protein